MGYKISRFLTLISGCCLVVGCDNEVKQTKEDLSKYPEINLFFVTAGEFINGSTNLDVGGSLLKFKPVKQVLPQEFFENLNIKATSEGWKLKQTSESQWTYERTVEQNIALPMLYSVDVQLDQCSNEVIIGWDRSFIQFPRKCCDPAM
jgi:hypothetical protein